MPRGFVVCQWLLAPCGQQLVKAVKRLLARLLQVAASIAVLNSPPPVLSPGWLEGKAGQAG